MPYSYTQISQYLTCPRRYRHRYLDGWKEKDTRAAMLFGRAFELALAAYFRSEDPGDVLFREWSACKDQGLQFSDRDTWDRMLEQGIMLLIRFCQDDRIRIAQPHRNLQIKFNRQVDKNEFVAYIDGIGELDGRRCLLEWKTSSRRYCGRTKGNARSGSPVGLLFVDNWNCRSRSGGVCSQATRRDPIPADDDYRGATPGIWSPGRIHHPPNRVGRILATQRHSLPAESLQHLPVRGIVPGAPKDD